MNPVHDEAAAAAPYVLGALDHEERRAFEKHLVTCPVCQEEVRSLQRVATALAWSAPQRTPRADIRERVLAAATGSKAVVKPGAARWTVAQWLPLAAALVLAVGLGAYAWQLQGRLTSVEQRLVDAERRASAAEQATVEARRAAEGAQLTMAVLSAPDLARIELAGLAPSKGAKGLALWSRNRGMVFTTTNLPPPPPGRVYQVWVITAKPAPISAGLVTPSPSGSVAAFFQTPVDIDPPQAIGVTLEPAGGVPAPTGPMYLFGKPSV
jgi:anti-sigma-K factor RskA